MKNTDNLSRAFLKQVNKIHTSATQNIDLEYSKVLKGTGQRDAAHAAPSLPVPAEARKHSPTAAIGTLCQRPQQTCSLSKTNTSASFFFLGGKVTQLTNKLILYHLYM